MKINFGQIVLLWGAATNIYRAFSKDCSGVNGIGVVQNRATPGSIQCANGRYSTNRGRGACSGNGGIKPTARPRKRRNLAQPATTAELVDNLIV